MKARNHQTKEKTNEKDTEEIAMSTIVVCNTYRASETHCQYIATRTTIIYPH